MMDEQSKFTEALASVTIRAEENGGKLSAEEAKDFGLIDKVIYSR